MNLNLKLNWKAMGIAFLVTFILSFLSGIYLPKNAGLISPIIGGLLAGFIVGESFTSGIVNGGISAGIAGLIYLPLITYLSRNLISTTLNNLGYYISPETLLISVVLGTALVGFAMYFVLGIIGGIIGVAIKGRDT